MAGYGSASRLEFLPVPLSHSAGGPAGILISTNLGAGQIDRAVKASWSAVLIAIGDSEAVGAAAAIFPDVWTGLFSADPVIRSTRAEHLRVVGPFLGIFGLGYVLYCYCTGQATGRLGLPLLGALARAAIASAGGYALLRAESSLQSNFLVVSIGTTNFGLIALPALANRVGFLSKSTA